jgi:hypothetical protein
MTPFLVSRDGTRGADPRMRIKLARSGSELSPRPHTEEFVLRPLRAVLKNVLTHTVLWSFLRALVSAEGVPLAFEAMMGIIRGSGQMTRWDETSPEDECDSWCV